jgi:magnesium-transporting ATPase (P-type)
MTAAARSLRTIGMLIGAPTLWMAHFLITYLVAEQACMRRGGDEPLLNSATIKVVIIAATVVFLVLFVVLRRTVRPDRDDRRTQEVAFVDQVLSMSAWFFGLALVATVVQVVVLRSPC